MSEVLAVEDASGGSISSRRIPIRSLSCANCPLSNDGKICDSVAGKVIAEVGEHSSLDMTRITVAAAANILLTTMVDETRRLANKVGNAACTTAREAFKAK
ncbi:hypothetical protein JNM87_05510 [Candidatus Saccharibacteria bacterium]|nr:hypothetical protein [Candidatus Saccharibacteria bacterium]